MAGSKIVLISPNGTIVPVSGTIVQIFGVIPTSGSMSLGSDMTTASNMLPAIAAASSNDVFASIQTHFPIKTGEKLFAGAGMNVLIMVE